MNTETRLEITPRLLEGLRVGNGWVSVDRKGFRWFVDGPGFEHEVRDFRPPACGHCTIGEAFGALLGFLSACADSRNYAERKGNDPMTGENSDPFPPEVGEWAQLNSSEIEMLAFDLENAGPDDEDDDDETFETAKQ